MKITLINPPQIFSKNQVASGVTPPLGIAYLAAYLLEDKYDVAVIDALGEQPQNIYPYKKGTFLRGLSFENIIKRIDEKSSVIGLSNLFSFAYPAVVDLVKLIKEKFPQAKIVLGGPHPSALYKEILNEVKEVDFIVIGEGEESLLRLLLFLDKKIDQDALTGLALRDPQTNEVILTKSTKRLLELEQGKVPFPARHLLPMENYIKTQESHGSSNGRWTSLLSSRGCPYGCTFCQSRQTRWVSRDAIDVVNEIELCMKTWGIEEFHFEDDNMTVNQKRLFEICDEIIKRNLKIKWQTPNGIRASRTNKEMLIKMKESGCCHITLAPETGSQRVIDEIIKKGNDFSFDQLKDCGKIAHKIGLKVAAYFILGLPGERKEDVLETIAYAKELAKVGVDEVAFGLFIPLPGTPLWDISQDKLQGKDWLDLLTIGDLSKAVSFNDLIDAKDLDKLRRRAYLTFFFYKILYHPLSSFKSFFNIIRDREETKSERALNTFLRRYGFRKKKKVVKNIYPYNAAKTLSTLLKTGPQYSYNESLNKTLKLLTKRPYQIVKYFLNK